MKECNILRGSNILWPNIFYGVRTSQPQDLRPLWATRAVDDRLWEGRHMSRDLWGLSTTDHMHPRFGHDNLSPVEQQRHWLEDIVYLELIRQGWQHRQHKQDQLSDKWCYETCGYTTVLNERMWHFQGGVKHTLPRPTYFQGGHDPSHRIYAPAWTYLQFIHLF